VVLCERPATRSCAAQISKQDLIQKLRRRGKGSQTSSSKFRGVTKHQKGKWEARIGQVRATPIARALVRKDSGSGLNMLRAAVMRLCVAPYVSASHVPHSWSLDGVVASPFQLPMLLRFVVVPSLFLLLGVFAALLQVPSLLCCFQVPGKKYKYLGLFPTEHEAAVVYDRAAVAARGAAAQTNFDISNYLNLLSAHPSPTHPCFTPAGLIV
jgi:hypothetical protein